MSKKLFVGGLNFKTTEDILRDIFAEAGEVSEVKIIIDRETGRSKGFGFVSYVDADAAADAVRRFDGQEVDGRRVKVSEAIENNDRGPRGGGGGGRGPRGGGGGGFGGGGFGGGGNRY